MYFKDISVETGRVIVRPALLKDYPGFVSGYKNCSPSQNRFDEGCFDTGFMTVEWYQKLLERRETEANNDLSYMFNIFLKDNSTSIGYCDITTHQREDLQYARIGYTIHNTHWRKGYGTESVSAIIKIGFDILNFHRLEAHINLDNPASSKVIQKAGFLFESVRKGFILEEGVWTDNEVYYMNNPNWKLKG